MPNFSSLVLSGSHPWTVSVRRDCSCPRPMTQTPVSLPVRSSPIGPRRCLAPADPVWAAGGRAGLPMLAEWALGPNGNPCLLQQSNPEARGILNRAERASPVLLGTPLPPCQHTPEQVGPRAPPPHSPSVAFRRASPLLIWRLPSRRCRLSPSLLPHCSLSSWEVGACEPWGVGTFRAPPSHPSSRPPCTSSRQSPSPAQNRKWGEGLPRPHALAPSVAVLPNTPSPTSPPQRVLGCQRAQGSGSRSGTEPARGFLSCFLFASQPPELRTLPPTPSSP